MDYKNINVCGNTVILTGVQNFGMDDTLDCGQSFRWEKIADNKYEGIAFSRHLVVEMEKDKLMLHGSSLDDFNNIWCAYFDFDRDYGQLKKELSKDPVLAKAVKFAGGIRVLRQDSWEALCTFILSQNNNIPRIKGLVKRLCENFGEEIEGGFTFPEAKKLTGLTAEDLAPVRAGFRAKYILDAAEKVASGSINMSAVCELPVDEARAELMKILGVGPKVADCALLFGFNRIECMPADVWIKRALEMFYPCGFPTKYMPVAGLAQQYLYHYVRSCEDAMNRE